MPNYADRILGAFTSYYEETQYNGDDNPTVIQRWTDAGKGTLLFEEELTYTGLYPTTVVQKVYTNGVLTQTQTLTKTYDGSGNELTSTSVIS